MGGRDCTMVFGRTMKLNSKFKIQKLKLRSGFTKSEVLTVVCILVSLGLLAQYNLSLGAKKARDFERKEQMKSVANSMNGYLINNQAYPPSGPDYTFRSCGDLKCPIEDNQGMVCKWPTGIAVTSWRCSKHIYVVLPKQPDNASTKGEDVYRYVRLSKEEFVLESCLELSSDNEAVRVEKSMTGLNGENCPSGVIYQIKRGN